MGQSIRRRLFPPSPDGGGSSSGVFRWMSVRVRYAEAVNKADTFNSAFAVKRQNQCSFPTTAPWLTDPSLRRGNEEAPPPSPPVPRMQQRRGASGRPSGTDGSDFSYRMVVDSRYQRVTDGRSRLARLILVQALHQLVGGALLLLSLSKGTEPNKFAVLSVAAGLLAILVGEFGRRRTMAVLLRMYTSLSSIAVAFSVTCIIRSELFFKVTKQNMAPITSYELIDAVRVALGVLLQLVVIATTTRLLQNMSPPKRTS